MDQLPLKHPNLYYKFVSGYHGVSRSKQSSHFNSVSTEWLSNKALTEIQKLKVKLQYFIEGSIVDLAHIFSSTVFTRNLFPCSAGGD